MLGCEHDSTVDGRQPDGEKVGAPCPVRRIKPVMACRHDGAWNLLGRLLRESGAEEDREQLPQKPHHKLFTVPSFGAPSKADIASSHRRSGS